MHTKAIEKLSREDPEFAKNYKDNDGELTLEFRKRLSIKAFQSVAHYDSCISNYLSMKAEKTKFPSRIFYSFIKESEEYIFPSRKQ